MEFNKVIKERFATRSFKSDLVSDELITNILEVCRCAPTAKNQQPQKVFVVKSPEGISK